MPSKMKMVIIMATIISLTIIVVSYYVGMQPKKDAAATRSIAVAAKLYYIDHKFYPSNLEELLCFKNDSGVPENFPYAKTIIYNVSCNRDKAYLNGKEIQSILDGE